MYTTGCYLVIDVAEGTVAYATAGHPKPLLISGDRTEVAPLPGNGVAGPALGIFPGTYYGMNVSSLEKGDIIMMFTDGLYEVQSAEGTMFDEQLLLATVRRHLALSSDRLFENVIEDIRAFSAANKFDDDVCLLGVEVQKLLVSC
jgi:serine phosphatase RsbU (regulator of sigma subunit)